MGSVPSANMYATNNWRDASQMALNYRSSGKKRIIFGSRMGSRESKGSEETGLG